MVSWTSGPDGRMKHDMNNRLGGRRKLGSARDDKTFDQLGDRDGAHDAPSPSVPPSDVTERTDKISTVGMRDRMA